MGWIFLFGRLYNLKQLPGRMILPHQAVSFSGVKIVICDVYGTLMKVEPGPADAGERWQWLWGSVFPDAERKAAGFLSLAEFRAGCLREIARVHVDKKKRGIAFPEVVWREVVCAAAPALGQLSRKAIEGFLSEHAALERTCSAMPGAREFLEKARKCGMPLGIASNAQEYTLGELEAAGIPLEWFEDDLCFWSWREGFSKPDAGVFRKLTRRLRGWGIEPGEILMVGDRVDNDIQPALEAGWQAHHFTGWWPLVETAEK